MGTSRNKYIQTGKYVDCNECRITDWSIAGESNPGKRPTAFRNSADLVFRNSTGRLDIFRVGNSGASGSAHTGYGNTTGYLNVCTTDSNAGI